MDPFTVLNAAGNIAQFMEYTREVYVQIKEIRSSASGITRRNTDLIWSASELHDMVDNITYDMSSFEHANTPTEKRIRDIGSQCQDLAKDLRTAIEKKASKDQAHFFAAFKSAAFGRWKPSDIDNKLGQLERLQDTLFKCLMVHISNQQAGLRTAVMNLAEQNRHLGVSRTKDISSLKDDLFSAIPISDCLDSGSSFRSTDSRFEDMKELVESWSMRATGLQKEQQIIESLYFEDMPYRRDTILDAWAETFRWIYDKRLSFKDWLESGDGVYWISGHPGSGKSTLIKFLSTDQATHENLRKWAGTKKLVKASFHFWFSGSDIQKSQEGLLRSLLFEIFRQCPSIMPSACPERWHQSSTRPWSRAELLDTLKRLHLQSPGTRFCFFIDGLDEYQDQALAPTRSEDAPAANVAEIIDVMATLSKLEDVKLCLSSRPWQAFEQAYGADKTRKLYVDQENREDIRVYVRDKFEKSEVFIRSQVGNKALEMEGIVESIVENSRGVFLWVALVIESLLRGLSNQDNLAELKDRLSETPKTLNGMFERMLSSVETRYEEEAAQILQVALHANAPLKLFAYAHVGDRGYNALKIPTRTWDREECVALAEATETRIRVRCPDLIKVNDHRRPGEAFDAQVNILVDFLHRTVRDFLTLSDTQKCLKQRLRKQFDPGRYICEALVGQIKGADLEKCNHWDFDDHDFGDSDIDYSREVQGDFMQLLDHVKREELSSAKSQKDLLDEMRSVSVAQGWQDSSVSFLGLMVACNMLLYVKEYMPDGIKSHGGITPLLQCALNPPPEYSSIYLSGMPLVEMVTLLLENGADPNEMSCTEGNTVWEYFLKTKYRKRKGLKQHISDKDRADFSIMKTMLLHGADSQVRCLYKARNGQEATMGLTEMLRDVYGTYPEELEQLDHLQSVIMQKQETYKSGKGGTPANVPEHGSWGLNVGISRSLGWVTSSLFS